MSAKTYATVLTSGITWILMFSIVMAESNTLELTAILNKGKVLLGEPIFVNVTLTNVGKESLYATDFPEAYHLSVASTDEKFKAYLCTPLLGMKWERHKKKLDPGKSLKVRLIVLLDVKAALRTASTKNSSSQHLAFTKAGKYQLKVRYNVVETQPLNVEIVEAPLQDKEIWEFLQSSPEIGIATQFGDHLSEGTTEKITLLLNKHPNSAYAPYLKSLTMGEGTGE